MTYKNIDAVLLGTNLSLKYKYLDINASYTYAKNSNTGNPLSEIAPLTVINSPEFSGFIFTIKHIYNDAQQRIDNLLNVSSSGA